MKIAIAQTEIAFEAQESNLKKAERLICQAAGSGADLIVFPEMSFTGFTMHVELAASLSDAALEKMQQLAVSYRIAVGFGWVALDADGRGENHYTLLDKSGSVVTDYTKIHPFSYGGEDQFYRSGEKIVYGLLCGIPLSTLICYDLRFPEVFRLAALRASLLIVPANWLSCRSKHWELLLRARAVENQVYVLGVNCVGCQNDYRFVGGSCLVNPEGETLVQCGSAEQIAFAVIEDDTPVFRERFPTCRDAQLKRYARWYGEI